MDGNIENRKSKCSTAALPTLGEKRGELWSTEKKVISAHVDPPKINTARAV